MIALLDYGAGNIRSVEKALRFVGAEVKRMASPDGLDAATGVVLPGVGAFDDCIHSMQRQELLGASREWIRSGKPFLGICVGYQALFERSEEFNSCALGLGVFQGPVVRFQPTPEEPQLKIPQIGWNQVQHAVEGCPLFEGIPDGSYFYFVHSFYAKPTNPDHSAAETDYGGLFTCAVARDNIFATQFHPEKSAAHGLALYRNYLHWNP